MSKLNFNNKVIIGMVHCLALPGTVNFKDDMDEIIEKAIEDALTLEKAGVDAIMIENMGDDPFGVTLDTPQKCALAAISALIKEKVTIPIGIDAAMNDYETSLSIAKAINADFVRIPVFVDTVEYYGGIVKPCAREAMLFRKNIDAQNIQVFVDIQVKHTHMVLSNIAIEDSAKTAISCGADALIVTGTHTGGETPIELIERVKKLSNIPVIIGSGVNKNNIKEQFKIADGAIVGSSLKMNKKIENPISYELTKEMVEAKK